MVSFCLACCGGVSGWVPAELLGMGEFRGRKACRYSDVVLFAFLHECGGVLGMGVLKGRRIVCVVCLKCECV